MDIPFGKILFNEKCFFVRKKKREYRRKEEQSEPFYLSGIKVHLNKIWILPILAVAKTASLLFVNFISQNKKYD